jgi:hypothetical protein
VFGLLLLALTAMELHLSAFTACKELKAAAFTARNDSKGLTAFRIIAGEDVNVDRGCRVMGSLGQPQAAEEHGSEKQESEGKSLDASFHEYFPFFLSFFV